MACFSRPFSDPGKRFLSKPQLARYLGNTMEVHAIDPRAGRMLTNKLHRNRHKHRYDNNNHQIKVREFESRIMCNLFDH